jgi:hypothetical protein
MTSANVQILILCVTVIAICTLGSYVIRKGIDAPKALTAVGGDEVRKTIESIAKTIHDLFGATPQITFKRTIIQAAPSAIRELYLYKQSQITREELRSTWFSGTKTLVVAQSLIIRAGFYLNRLHLEFDDSGRTMRATISDSLLVVVEQDGPFRVEQSESGWWNRISQEERDQLINSLPEKAKDQIETASLRQLAAVKLKEELNGVCGAKQIVLHLVCEDALTKVAINSPTHPSLS